MSIRSVEELVANETKERNLKNKLQPHEDWHSSKSCSTVSQNPVKIMISPARPQSKTQRATKARQNQKGKHSMRFSRGAYLQIVCCSTKQLIDKNQGQRGNANLSVVRRKVFFSDELFVFVNSLKR